MSGISSTEPTGAAGLLGVLPAVALLGYLALVPPIAGRSRYRALAHRQELDPTTRLTAYRASITRQGLLALVAVLVIAASGTPLGDLGLAPHVRHLRAIAPGLVGLTLLGLVLGLALRTQPAVRRRVLRPVAALLPATRPERRLFVGVAVTAGIAEEIVFRGFLLVCLTEIVPQTSLGAALVVSSALFGLAHSYQGWLGVLLTGVAGYWLAGLYVLTGSLALPIVVHALVDLRLLLALPTGAPDPG